MYSRCDVKVVHCCNSYLREGGSFKQGGGAGGGVTDFEGERVGGGGWLLQQTVARKHLWLLFALDKKCQN